MDSRKRALMTREPTSLPTNLPSDHSPPTPCTPWDETNGMRCVIDACEHLAEHGPYGFLCRCHKD